MTPTILPVHDHAGRRARFAALLGGTPAVVPAARIAYRSRDTALRFRQDSDFLYLTGFPEPDAVAVFDRGAFHLFVLPRDPSREAWDGEREGVEGAKRYGAAGWPLDRLDDFLSDTLAGADRLAIPLGRDPRLDAWWAKLPALRKRGPNPELVDPSAILAEMRLRKEESEIAALEAAAAITAEAHARAAEALRPGAGEWEIEALLEYEFRRRGAAGPAYPSIVGAGRNATTLHYVRNDRAIGPGDLVLVDAGAEWGGYCADVTRTLTASGQPSAAQRAVLDVVASAQAAAMERCAPGATFDGVHEAAQAVLADGLVAMGVLEGPASRVLEQGLQKPYALHRTSHWLGLDVHDPGAAAPGGSPRVLEPGMVLTVEPGLYFRDDVPAPDAYRGIGVRIEDDVLITAEGHRVLSRTEPR
ncbi:MAG TPA: aminopeptidase P family protein [Thermoanaerobaculia bacterium]|nr:aminopeptidase P family protein [Thermoanaerobaculia bacterium]